MEKIKKATTTSVAKKEDPKSLKSLVGTDFVKNKFKEVLGKNATAFVTSMVSLVSTSDALQGVDASSIIGSAMISATLDLPINQSLGRAYIVPYNVKQKDGSYKKMAQFQLGYKGLRTLAIRSGQYLQLHTKPVYEGQIEDTDTFLGYKFVWKNKSSDVVIGYASHYELLNGFESTLYMSISDIEKHAKKYSKTYAKGYGNWKDDFEKMALKTVSKLHLNSGEAPLSVEMQTAIEKDQSVIDINGNKQYVDNENTIDIEHEISENANKEIIDITRDEVIDESTGEITTKEKASSTTKTGGQRNIKFSE